ncbi:TPA: small membrane protein, partial [Klebsiella quasipneumoniae subsp. quasipneumoniae]|nr:small membrane protein [Klebsiella quasipneumoniae subsp. quasipneumoniae]
GSYILLIMAAVLLGCSIYSLLSYLKERAGKRRAFRKRR